MCGQTTKGSAALRSPVWALPGPGHGGEEEQRRAGCILGALVRSRELLSTLASQSQPPCLLESSPVRGWPSLARGWDPCSRGTLQSFW